MASAGTVYVDVLPRMDRFTSTLSGQATAAGNQLGSTLSRTLSSTGSKLTGWGKTWTRNVTLPIVGAGVVAGKMALDFEGAFTKIGALSNTNAKDLASWKTQVLQLSGATARSPQELADALYFLASAGLKTTDVMPALSASAHAAATGLGDTADVAKITAQALNAYAGSGLHATDVTDTLVNAVKAGTADPQEFATALGRILPIASKAGVSFDQVAASLAGLSNIGLDVNEGVTAMRGVLQALVAPSSTAAKAMKDVGLSADQMRSAIADKGLLGAMQLLDKATGGNIDKLRQIIPNIRALTGQFGLTGDNAKTVAAIFDQVANSTGAASKAFAETAKGPAFQMQQSLNNLRVDAIKLGEKLIPIGQKIVDFVSGLVDKFTSLPASEQEAFLKLAAFAALVGPLLRVAGAVFKIAGAVSSIGRIGSIGGNLLGGLGGTAGAVGGLSSALLGGAGLVAGLLALKAIAPGASDALHNFIDTLGGLKREGIDPGFLHDLLNFGTQHTGFDPTEITAEGKAIQEMAAQLAHGNFSGQEFDNVLKTIAADSKVAAAAGLHPMRLEVESLASGFKSGYLNSYQLAGGMKALGISTFQSEESFHAFANVMTNAQGATGQTITSTQKLIDGIYKAGGSLSDFRISDLKLQLELGHTGKVITFLRNKLQDLRGSADGAGKGLDHVGNGAKGATKDIDGAGRVSRTTSTEFHKLGGASDAVAHGAKAVAGALKGVAGGFRSAGGASKGAAGGFKGAGGAADDASGKVKNLDGALGEVGRMHPRPTITVDTGNAQAAVGSVLGLLNSVDGFVAHAVISVSRQVTTAAGGSLGGVIGLQGGGITQAPVFQFGEGNYSTPWGKGAELVQPLDTRGIGILGDALDRADQRRRGRGGDGGGSRVVSLVGKLEIVNGEAYIRGIARDEIDDDHRYAASLARR